MRNIGSMELFLVSKLGELRKESADYINYARSYSHGQIFAFEEMLQFVRYIKEARKSEAK